MVEAVMVGIQVVMHCAAGLPLTSGAGIWSTAVKGTRIPLDCANRHGARRFTFISSTAVYDTPGGHPIHDG
jgi:nucleoside-diphosphate-sugar epimerase